ncbi:MAG TPA: molecular chaperone HtpG [Desulfitobacteriaceae bacterium]|nr:molecular chaperone HtpG [Desulfitobacteriaceae bacterium]
MTNNTIETREFQTEIRQLLDIVIHSLYTDRQIFLRELISNAADALEKLRYTQISGLEIVDPDLPLEITIEADDSAHTLTISDTGIGMTREELIENLGTIAHSGSKEFFQKLKEGDKKDLNLIGQFGVGFYSAFMVAEKVTLFTRSIDPEATGCLWISEGTGNYSLDVAPEQSRGTKIILHFKEDAWEYGNVDTIKRIIRQYSSFVPFPINVNGEKVNTVQALWTKNKNQISEEEYTEFYKYIANAYDEPQFRLHFSSDAPISINALLFVPKDNFEIHGFGRTEPGVNLYCKKVLIQEQAPDILPEWLRFVKGVIDSEELPLNISRETMQDSALIVKLNKVVTGRFLKFLAEQAESEPQKYQEFWKKFQMFLKEGAANDFNHRSDLLKLLRFESSKTEENQLISLADYLGRMKENQNAIYFLNGPNRETIEAGPYIEIFKNNDFEVIYTNEAIDDYIFGLVREFEGKKILSADQNDLELPEPEEKPAAEESLTAEEISALTKWLKETLGEKVTEVRESKRLVDSPAIILTTHGTHSMHRVMQLMSKELNFSDSCIFEINSRHPLIKRLNSLIVKNDPFAKVASEQLFENARISAGLLVDPKEMVSRLYQILERSLG